MIEKFNFYDVYGYFLPGFTLLAILWAPFGLIKKVWPSMALTSAVAAVIFAYIVGHLIQIIAHHALPSQIKDSSGCTRYPSSVLLDRDGTPFPSEFKTNLAKLVRDSFGIDLGIDTAWTCENRKEQKAIDRQRQQAFFLCRGVLIREKIATYAEQFEGMYTFMRGLTTVFALAFSYFAGWSASHWRSNAGTRLALVSIGIGLAVATVIGFLTSFSRLLQENRFRAEKITFVSLMLILVGIGYILGGAYAISIREAGLLSLLSVSALSISLRCFGAYKSFAREFAKAIWQDFAGHCLHQPRKAA